MRPPRLKKLVFERFGCFGPSPVYRVEVDDDGFVEWEGRYFVKSEGELSWRISREEVATLERQLEGARFRELRGNFDNGADDAAACRIRAAYDGGTTHAVHHRHGDDSAPRELRRLEDRIDLILGTAPHVGPREDSLHVD
jgi:hypothetical protein